MSKIFVLLLSVFSFAQNLFCQDFNEQKLLGSWFLNISDEIPDQIIFRSDKKYFVYNASPDATSSITTGKPKKSNELIIDGSYTRIIETGTWEYQPSIKQLTLKGRNLLKKPSDFSDTYGYSKELKFLLKNLTERGFEICHRSQNKDLCDKYKRDSSYKELNKEYSGTGAQTKEVILSGYETEFSVSYDSKTHCRLVIKDQVGKEVEKSEKLINGINVITTKLDGVTRLTIKIMVESTSKWNLKIKAL